MVPTPWFASAQYSKIALARDAGNRDTCDVTEADSSTSVRRRRSLAISVAALVAAAIGAGILLRSDEQQETTPESMVPDQDCVALQGPEPWVTLFDRSQTQPCVVVAEFQNVQVWNKGFEPMTVDWPDGERRVAIDEHFDTGPIGDVLQAGPNKIDAAPFPMPTIWLLPESLSPTAGINGTSDGFGPVRVGMTLDEASTALGLELEAPGEATPEPYRWLAAVSGDPYSPTFLADGPDDGTSVIVEIHLHDPRD